VPATLNFPVTSGAEFWTEPNSRAEIQIGSTDLRLDQRTAIRMLRLDDAATQIQIDQGSINLRLRAAPPGGTRILTPHATVVVNEAGRYHVDVAAPQDGQSSDHTRVAVLEGSAHIEGLTAPLTVTAGHSATMRAGDVYPMLAQAIALPLDTWALERERLLTPRQTLQYVSPEMTGVRELDNYGHWVSEPSYGAVWYPRSMAADWAPYRYGYWAYVRPWGWTWIDHQPWGFAPFHYGRWVRVHERWGWHPGHRVHRPVYAPALVIFASGGGGSTVLLPPGRRSPAVGWAPLGPHEIYRPYHRHSPRYGRDVNIAYVQTANLTGITREADRDSGRGLRHRDGLTVVSAESFAGAAAVDKTRIVLRDGDWTDARRVESLDHLRPSRSARAGVMRPTAVSSSDATGDGKIATPNQPRQGFRRGERDDDGRARAAIVRPALGTAPARDPDEPPQAPGPNRIRQRADSTPPVTGQGREPGVSPLNRIDRAAPALRAPDSATAAPPALRRSEPPSRVTGSAATTPPGRAAGTPAEPPNRAPNSNRDARDTRDGSGKRREPADLRMIDPRHEPRALAPPQQPRQITPGQAPGSAPQTVAPSRPITPQSAALPARPIHRDGNRVDGERRGEARAVAAPPNLSRPAVQPHTSTPPIERLTRPESAAPQRIAPPQPRHEDRQMRHESKRQENTATRAPIMPQQAVRPPQAPPPRQTTPQSVERRAPQAVPQSANRPREQENRPQRQEAPEQTRRRTQDPNGRRMN
jgi:hypothetical protein